MRSIIYYTSLPFIFFVSLLSFPLLYLVSDFFFFIICRIIGYRKKVVRRNLKNSFPEKSDAEISQLTKDFYRYLCDLFLETFKTLTISKNEAVKHFQLTSETISLFNKYYEQRRSIIIVMGHSGNWEWAGNTFSILCKNQLYVIYHPLMNPHFNKLIYRMRTRFGTQLIEMKNTFKDMVKSKNIVSATAFIADQTPAPESAYWTKFMNQDTPVFTGTEKIARKLNYPVVFVSVNRIKRGYYIANAETLFENPALTAVGEISEAHIKRLEQEIIKQPEIWLWSHKRWKHKRPVYK